MKSKKVLALLLAAIMVFCMTACGGSGSGSEEIAARITPLDSDETAAEITEGDVEGIIILAVHLTGQDMESIKNDKDLYTALKQDILQSMVSVELMRLDLEENGVEVFPDDYKDRLSEFAKSSQVKGAGVGKDIITRYFEMNYYAEALRSEEAKTISDEEVRKYYDDNRATKYTATAAEGKVSHILVDSEELANEIYDKIAGGADFAEMAKQYGTDGTKDNGGSLGTLSEDDQNYDADFMKGAFALKSGEVSKPVKTQFGYHLIKMEDRKEAGGVTAFEDVEEEIRSQLAGEQAAERLTETADRYKIEFMGEYESMNESDDGDAEDQADGNGADGEADGSGADGGTGAEKGDGGGDE